MFVYLLGRYCGRVLGASTRGRLFKGNPPLFPVGEPRPPPEAPNTLAHTTNAHIVVYLKSKPVPAQDNVHMHRLLSSSIFNTILEVLIHILHYTISIKLCMVF